MFTYVTILSGSLSQSLPPSLSEREKERECTFICDEREQPHLKKE